jgi:hypothetical protein
MMRMISNITPLFLFYFLKRGITPLLQLQNLGVTYETKQAKVFIFIA